MKKIGNETRVTTSMKIEPKMLAKIKEIYGGISNFMNEKIKRDRKLKEAK